MEQDCSSHGGGMQEVMLLSGQCFMSCAEYRVAAAQLRDVYSKYTQLMARAGVSLCVPGPGA